MQDFEKLGVFYLGKSYDLDARKRRDDLLLYDARDLVTHAVCVGMTGSGKTGLCLSLLEEAAIDGIPAIVIDPKGDLANLLLTFPNLTPEEFLPWVNADDAQRKGLSLPQHAEEQSKLWTKGLADWGQDAARVRRLRDAADFTIYTPGATFGRPVAILRSLAAPAPAIIDDAELFRSHISTTVTSLLGLLHIDADPLRSREHILLSTLLHRAWSESTDLDIAALIQQIQQPPVTRLGVMELEAVFPAKDRFDLAMSLNNLIASPGFESWTQGEPLDIASFLRAPSGKPRISIFSIAHLSDAERMFFVSLLLNQTLGWVRTQSGSTSLRALLYMDEIAGYFPPTANPPSKQPLLTLMKQARAFGFGVVLATQNPVDIDYKGLANAGTWFIGRLQTERDKARLIDGLQGAADQAGKSFDRAAIDRALSSLASRVFLMNNIHDDGPSIFESRWALSYLRGPLTRQQIKSLTAAATTPSTPAPSSSAPSIAPAKSPAPNGNISSRPVLPPEVPQYFLPICSTAPASATLTYHPMLMGSGKVFFSDTKLAIEHEVIAAALVPIIPGPVAADWDHSEPTDLTDRDLENDPSPVATFLLLAPDAAKPKNYDTWKRSFADALLRTTRLEFLRCDTLEQTSLPGESERDFRARLIHSAREERDAATEKLRAKYAPKLAALTDRLRKAEQRVQVEKEQASSSQVSTFLSIGTSLLGAFMGRKVVSATNLSRASTAARSVGRASKESADVGRAQENADALRQQLAEIEQEFNDEVAAITARLDPSTEPLEKVSIKPKKTNIQVRAVVLAWAPYWSSPSGDTPAWH